MSYTCHCSYCKIKLEQVPSSEFKHVDISLFDLIKVSLKESDDQEHGN
jgi:hypothetical protein